MVRSNRKTRRRIGRLPRPAVPPIFVIFRGGGTNQNVATVAPPHRSIHRLPRQLRSPFVQRFVDAVNPERLEVAPERHGLVVIPLEARLLHAERPLHLLPHELDASVHGYASHPQRPGATQSGDQPDVSRLVPARTRTARHPAARRGPDFGTPVVVQDRAGSGGAVGAGAGSAVEAEDVLPLRGYHLPAAMPSFLRFGGGLLGCAGGGEEPSDRGRGGDEPPPRGERRGEGARPGGVTDVAGRGGREGREIRRRCRQPPLASGDRRGAFRRGTDDAAMRSPYGREGKESH